MPQLVGEAAVFTEDDAFEDSFPLAAQAPRDRSSQPPAERIGNASEPTAMPDDVPAVDPQNDMDTVASQPGVSAVIASSEILAENRFGLIEIVTQDRGVSVDDALRLSDLDRARITAWQWCDVGDQRGLAQGASFFIGKDAVISEIFFPWLCVAFDNGIEQLLGAADKFVLRDRIVCHGEPCGNNPKHGERHGEREEPDVHVRE